MSARAQRLHSLPAAAFEEMVSEGRREVDRTAERRVVKAVEIAEARASYEARADAGGRVQHLAALIADGKKFSVIYADPPWSFKVYSGKGKQRSADRHYDTQSIDYIKKLPVEMLDPRVRPTLPQLRCLAPEPAATTETAQL